MDGKRVFVVGAQQRGELARFDSKSGQFVPYLSGIPAEGVAFSRDGQWAAHVTFPEGNLWRSKLHGSERLQLSFLPMTASMSEWSPDGKQIAFQGITPGRSWRVYAVSADGGSPQQLAPEERSEAHPSWSPDGNWVCWAGLDPAGGRGPGNRLLDLRTHKISTLPGSDGLSSPVWSPEGRYIMALSADSQRLMLCDFPSSKWVELTESKAANLSWSRDGKNIYFESSLLTRDPAIFRLRISDHKLERAVSMRGVRRVLGCCGFWMGLTPDDSPLVTRDVGSQEIYALDWEAP